MYKKKKNTFDQRNFYRKNLEFKFLYLKIKIKIKSLLLCLRSSTIFFSFFKGKYIQKDTFFTKNVLTDLYNKTLLL